MDSNGVATPRKVPPALSQLRLSQDGTDSLTDLELFELVLSFAVPQENAKKIALTLLAHFGSYTKAVRAPISELRRIKGLGEDGITILKLLLETMFRTLRSDAFKGPVISNLDSLIQYLTVLYKGEAKESLRCLFLDSRNKLIADEVIAVGTVNELTVYPREVIERALALHANALILAHNHPSSSPKPSELDVMATKGIKEAAASIGIVLHDHVIIAGTEWYSFRQDGTFWTLEDDTSWILDRNDQF